MWWKKLAPQPATKQTEWGEFLKTRDGWEGFMEINEAEVRVVAEDVGGELSPRLLGLLCEIHSNGADLERVAREAVPRLSPEHVWDSIDATEEVDLWLNFSFGNEVWSETVCVGFKKWKVTGWWSWN